MENGSRSRRFISTLMDDESEDLTSSQIDALHSSEEQREIWSLYHQIGDLIRFEHQYVSDDFEKTMSRRLEVEPALTASPQKQTDIRTAVSGKWMWMAAMLAVFLAVPLYMMHLMPASSVQENSKSVYVQADMKYFSDDVLITENKKMNNFVSSAANAEEYLFAHQNSDSFIYGATNFSRPVNFTYAIEK